MVTFCHMKTYNIKALNVFWKARMFYSTFNFISSIIHACMYKVMMVEEIKMGCLYHKVKLEADIYVTAVLVGTLVCYLFDMYFVC